MTRQAEFELIVVCELDEEYFGDWNELAPDIQAFWESAEHSNCEGDGRMGAICQGCSFCVDFDENPT